MLKKWCTDTWLYVMYAIGAVMALLLLWKWDQWSHTVKLLVSITIIVPLHVAEEWRLPGGFHYIYNLIFRSPSPNVYPMNTLVDMSTNFFGELFFLSIPLLWPSNGALISLNFLCYLEVVGHTALSVFAYVKFRPQGKRTIYAPGMVTAYCAFLPAGILMTRHLLTVQLTPRDYFTAVVTLAGIVACLVLPDVLFKDKNTPYPFPSARYFKQYE